MDYRQNNFRLFNLPSVKWAIPLIQQTYGRLRKTQYIPTKLKAKKPTSVLRIPNSFMQVLQNAKINFKTSQIKISYNTLIFIDKDKKKVTRLAFNNKGNKSIKNHCEFLRQKYLKPIPSLIKVFSINNYQISQETLLPGETLTVKQTSAKEFEKIIRNLTPLYSHIYVVKNFSLEKEMDKYNTLTEEYPYTWQSQLSGIRQKLIRKLPGDQSSKVVNCLIHGDLNFENILKNEKKYFFTDFDRATIGFPEYDALLFGIYRTIYKSKSPTYRELLNELISLVHNSKMLPEIDIMYEIFPSFRNNIKATRTIGALFVYRTICLTLQNFSPKEQMPQDLLDRAQQQL